MDEDRNARLQKEFFRKAAEKSTLETPAAVAAREDNFSFQLLSVTHQSFHAPPKSRGGADHHRGRLQSRRPVAFQGKHCALEGALGRGKVSFCCFFGELAG